MSVHDHLKILSPTDFSSVPTSDADLASYIQDAVSHCQAVVDSIPPPPEDFAPSISSSSTNVASTGNEVQTNSTISSSVPSPDPGMSKAWGKPMKLSAKDNPLNIAVYKMAAADRRGAWFARRSVHEGLGFARWKRALDTEFEESLAVHGEPGQGNVRGIGGEKELVRKDIPGVGEVGVMLLTAKFPGPSTPRDFVELLISSTTPPKGAETPAKGEEKPRQYLLVSRPVTHPDAPERSGFVRGQYESVEFIREIPVRKTKAVPTSNLPATINGSGKSEKKDDKKAANNASHSDTDLVNAKAGKISVEDAQAAIEANKAQGQNIPAEGFKGDTVDMAVDEDGDLNPNPIEWIMITRSDPGGSVPKFMVERGTPGAIVGDASKFLDWATKKEMPVAASADKSTNPNGDTDAATSASNTATASAAAQHAHRQSLTRTVTNLSSSSSDSDSDSFVSADSGNEDNTITPRPSNLSTSSGTDKYAHQEAELQKKLQAKKAREGAKLEESKAKHSGNDAKIKKAEERHERKLREADDWHEKEAGKVKGRRAKAERKVAARERKEKEKAENKDVAALVERLKEENEQLKAEVEKLKGSKADE